MIDFTLNLDGNFVIGIGLRPSLLLASIENGPTVDGCSLKNVSRERFGTFSLIHNENDVP